MKIPVTNICRIELRKMVKRKDLLSLLGILGVSILFAVSILTDSYVGAENQSADYWVATQMLNSSILLVSPMILAYSAVRTMAQEIENGSLKLLDQRIRNRERLYMAKAVALWIYSSMLFLASILIHILVYFLIVGKNDKFGSNHFFGENTTILICVMAAVYLSTFVLVPQIVLFMGTFCKQGICIGMIFMIILVAHNIYKVPVLGLLSPWTYIINLSNDVISSTDSIFMEPLYMIKNIIAQLGLCGIGSVICIYSGMNILRKRDL